MNYHHINRMRSRIARHRQCTGLCFLVIAFFGFCGSQITAQPTSLPASPASEVQRGAFQLGFTESHPLSDLNTQNSRYRIKVEPIQSYNLTDHSFEIYVPEQYLSDGADYGVLVWVSAGNSGRPPRSWQPLCDAKRLIAIGANDSGNDKGIAVRIGLAMDAVHNLKKLYKVDESRIYAAGVSGGGKVAGMLATIYPETFNGAITIIGVSYYRNIPIPGREPMVWQRNFERPAGNILDRAKLNSRFVIMTGSDDFNRDPMLVTYRDGFLKDGFRHVQYVEIPNHGHSMPTDVKWIDDALTSLDEPLTKNAANQSVARKPPATQNAQPPANVPIDKETAAMRLLSLAETYESNGLHLQAAERFESIVKNYPGTKAAVRAKQLRDRIKAAPR